jgi:hypothetical protein
MTEKAKVKRFLIWIRKPGDGIILDKRGKGTCWSIVLMVAFALAWGSMTVAIGQTLPESADKAITQGDLLRAQWWLIGGLLGLVLLIGQGFITYIVIGVKGNVRDIFIILGKVLTHEDHKEIDHSLYCAKCRGKG